MWRLWLLAGYVFGFILTVFLVWMFGGEDLPLTQHAVAFGSFFAPLLHLPVLLELRPAPLDEEAAIERWMADIGEWKVARRSAAIGSVGITIGVWGLGGSDCSVISFLVPPLAFLLALAWVGYQN
jgi:hypothetical protein